MSQEYPVKGTVSDAEYDALFKKHVKDIQGTLLAIGDKVAFSIARRWAGPVRIGTITDIKLLYGWRYDWNTNQNTVLKDQINVSVLIQDKKTVERCSSYIVKV